MLRILLLGVRLTLNQLPLHTHVYSGPKEKLQILQGQVTFYM